MSTTINISERDQVEAWLGDCAPGDRLLYFTGNLAAERYYLERAGKANAPLEVLAKYLLKLWDRGELHLFQRRIAGDNSAFDYIAERAAPPYRPRTTTYKRLPVTRVRHAGLRAKQPVIGNAIEEGNFAAVEGLSLEDLGDFDAKLAQDIPDIVPQFSPSSEEYLNGGASSGVEVNDRSERSDIDEFATAA